MTKLSTKYYIRFGDIPKNERSNVHQGDQIVKQENGVSVWNSAIANDIYYPILPVNPNECAVQDYVSFLWGNKRVYLVTGDELEEVGSCGEPLLVNVKIVCELTDDYKYQKELAGFMIRDVGKLDNDPIDIDKAVEHYEGTLELLKGVGLEV